MNKIIYTLLISTTSELSNYMTLFNNKLTSNLLNHIFIPEEKGGGEGGNAKIFL